MATVLKIDETLNNQTGTEDTSATLPTILSTRLNTIFGNTTWPSTIKQSAEKIGALSNFDAGTIDVAFTESDGDPLIGVDSGLVAIDGRKIFLYSDSGTGSNNNIVIGREGTSGGAADATGAIAFIIYLETNGSGAQGDVNATGADLWVVEFTTMQHYLNTDPANGAFNDPNDIVSIIGKLFVSVSNPINFSLSGAPSGQNAFLMFSDGSPGVDDNGDPDPDEVAIVVTASNAATGGTVNTGQGGGGTTIGTNNQMVDPDEAMLFSFVQGANIDFTVPNLTAGEAGNENNIDFDNFFETTSASFSVVQLQPPKFCTLQISASKAILDDNGTPGVPGDDVPFEQSDYFENQLNNTPINIDNVTLTRSVTVKKVTTVYIVTWDEDGLPSGTKKVGSAQAEALTATEIANLGLTVTFAANSDDVTIKGAIAGDNFKYVTDSEHDRVQITNIGNSDANYNAAFDIGAFKIESGGVKTDGLDNIDFADDGPDSAGTPVTPTVDEDGSPTIPGSVPNTNAALGDSNAGSTATGSIDGIFNAGRDGLKTFSLSTDTSNLASNLKSQGGTILYDVTGNTLTAYVNGSTAGYQAADDREVFTLVLSGTDNKDYLFTLYDQIDHPLTNDPSTTGVTEILFEDDLALNLGTVVMVQDKDNDTDKGEATDFVVTVDDDSPLFVGSTNLVYSNALNGAAGIGGTATFEYSIGTDDRDSYSNAAGGSDLLLSLSGTVGAASITSPSVTWGSETDLQATYNFSFTYISNPTTGATSVASGTIAFDKVLDTYTVKLAQPVASFSVLQLRDPGAGFTGYEFNSTTTMGGLAGVTTAQLSGSFFVQFKGFAEPPGNGNDTGNAIGGNANLDALELNEAWSSPDDDALGTNELFTLFKAGANPGDPAVLNPASVSISGSSAGTNSDTMQSGEVLDFTLYSGDPQGLLNPVNASKTTAATIFLEFDQLGFKDGLGEDMVIVLKLVDANNPNLTTTRAIVVDAADMFHNGDTLPTGFGFTSVSGDNGLVIIESQDYNAAGENWVIQGAQVLASTEGVTGSGINLNKAVGAGGASSGTQAFGTSADSGNGTLSTWDTDVFKIVNIGFVTNNTPDTTLSFAVQAVDFDGDKTASQTLTVKIEGDNSFAGSGTSDTISMRDIVLDLDIAMTQANRTVTGFDALAPDNDVLDFTTDAVAGNFEAAGSAFGSLNAFVTEADIQLDGTTKYYFGVFNGDGYLAYDDDGTGFTAIIKLVGVTTNFGHEDII